VMDGALTRWPVRDLIPVALGWLLAIAIVPRLGRARHAETCLGGTDRKIGA
jgi:hypothetical protein